VQSIVLDAATPLDMAFIPTSSRIIMLLPPQRQTLLSRRTFSEDIAS